MGFLSKFFTGAGPQVIHAPNAQPSIDALQKRVQELTKANEDYRERLEKRIEQNSSMRETLTTQKEKLIETQKLSRKEKLALKEQLAKTSRAAKKRSETVSAPMSMNYSEELDALNNKVDVLTKANETYRERLAARIEHNKTMQEVIKSLKAEINAKRTHNRKDMTLERMETFFTGTKLKLPIEAYESFLKKCEENAPEGKLELFLEEMEKTQFRAFFEQLFTVEMDMAQGFDFKRLGSIVSFQRGESDIALAAKQGITLDVMKANQIRITKERFDEIIKPEFIDPARVEGVCEIGSAWGAATRYLINRFEPETFHSYEIDTGWAQWLQDNLGVDSKQCDGESLSDTKSESMDICMASSCLYFMPFVKQWNYLVEFNRVLRPGGIAVFNVNMIEDATIATLKSLLSNFFPRRSFGYLPMHCIETAFPEDQFEKLVDDHTQTMGYHIFRKR